MGGGTHTKQNNVPKNPRDYSSGGATVGGGSGGGFDKGAAGSCLISFTARLKLASGTDSGTKFVLVPSGDGDELQIISAGRRIGVYSGNRLATLRQCIAGGYRYEGKVDGVTQGEDGLLGNCKITGLGPA